jgi:hypothetical protein
LLAIFYHYQFRTKKSIEFSFDWLDNISSSHVPREDRDLIRRLGQQLLASRKELCKFPSQRSRALCRSFD